MSTIQTNAQGHEVALFGFEGFYQSYHEMMFDMAEERLHASEDIDPDEPISITNLLAAQYCNRFVQAYKAYLKKRCNLDLPSLTIKTISMSNDYAMSGDRLFVVIDDADREKLFARKTDAALSDVIKQYFTPRPGFIPYYSNAIEDWTKPPAYWDLNELGALLHAVAGQPEDDAIIENDTGFDDALDDMIRASVSEKEAVEAH